MTTWGNFRDAVISQFQVPTNKVKAEFEFMNWRQESSETFDEFRSMRYDTWSLTALSEILTARG